MTEPSVPQVLLIGAMKAGTTSVAQELASHPAMYVPADKEPNSLLLRSANEIRRDYQSLYKGADVGAMLVDSSTAYSKAATSKEAAQSALEVLGEDIHVLFLVRDPLERAISQFRHEEAQKKVQRSLDEVLREPANRFVANSDYLSCLAPWFDLFDSSRVHLYDFHKYVNQRHAFMRTVFADLGIDQTYPGFDAEQVSNRNEARSRLPRDSPAAKFVSSRFYRRRVKPLVSDKYRQSIQQKAVRFSGQESTSTRHDLSAAGARDVSRICSEIEESFFARGFGDLTVSWPWRKHVEESLCRS